MRVIVDTSVWSLALRRRPKQLSAPQRAMVHALRDLMIDGRAVLLGLVRQEVLTGIGDRNTFESIQSYLHDFDDLPPDIDDYERAAAFANHYRTSGVAATPVDMLICSVAAARDLDIFTIDQDFDQYRRHVPIRLFSPG